MTYKYSQYEDLCRRVIDEGIWIENDRTGKRCLTVINADLEYDLTANEFPLVTTRKAFWKSAIAEMLGYLRGSDNAADFRKLGTKTWDANANQNEAWLNNPHRKGEDDMGRVYGV
ncbi:thymidylate synthase, partial [Vibrio anguillarum]